MASDRPEVLIVGAGPVGLYAALALSKRNVRVQVVDTGVWACTHSYALALHPQSLALLRELGIQERVLEDAYPVRSIGFYDREAQRLRVRLDQGDPQKCLAVMPQESFEGLLEKQLHAHGVEVQWRHEVASANARGGGVEVTLDRYEKESRGYVVAHTEWVVAKSTTAEFPFVIGADGYSSRVRRALGVEFPEVAPAQYYAVFEFKSDVDMGNEMRVVLGDGTTDVLWPLPDGFCRWSFELPGFQDPEQAQRDAGGATFPSRRFKDRRLVADWSESALEEKDLRELIAERAPWFKGRIEDLTWRTVVRFEHRLATAFGRGRMWLAGDSAHLTGPVAIQSMNLGLSEARELADGISSVLRDGASSDRLSGYGEKWLSQWRVMQGLDGGLRPSADTDPWLASHAAQIISCLPAHGDELASLIRQLRFML